MTMGTGELGNKNIFISYLNDDGKQKNIWIDSIEEETSSYICFYFQGDFLTIPFHRILKIKRRGENKDGDD